MLLLCHLSPRGHTHSRAAKSSLGSLSTLFSGYFIFHPVSQAISGGRRGTPSRGHQPLAGHTETTGLYAFTIKPRDTIESPINLARMFLERGRKWSRKTTRARGEHANSSHGLCTVRQTVANQSPHRAARLLTVFGVQSSILSPTHVLFSSPANILS